METIKTEHTNDELYDIIVIGGGPGGLSAALYAARAKMKTLVLDKNPSSGALGSADRIANYPGIPGNIGGTELLERMRAQAESFGTRVQQEQVYGVDFAARPFQVFTSNSSVRAKAVIIATGSMGRSATLTGEAELTGRGVSYCATCDAAFYQDKDVAIAGAVGEVIEEIEALVRFARRIHLVTREKEVPAEHAAFIASNPAISVKTGSRITAILGNDHVSGVTISGAQGAEQTLNVEGVFLYLHGNKPIVDYLYGAIETTAEGCIDVDRETMATSIEGVYAIGDVTCKKVRQVVIAAAEGCIAALSAEQYINKRGRAVSQWSH
ncbi:MAG TPA: FAD-dependent oxidoreductase [Spirochaetota bacterium]|nr:FAD-dependent oxidoreductase [Spirochaetota bacterium]